RIHKRVAEESLTKIGRCNVVTRLRLPMAGHVLQSCNDPISVAKCSVALESHDGSDTHFARQVWILTVSFFYATPSCVTGDIHNRRQCLMSTSQPCFLGDKGKDLFNKSRIESSGKAYGLRKARRSFCS